MNLKHKSIINLSGIMALALSIALIFLLSNSYLIGDVQAKPVADAIPSVTIDSSSVMIGEDFSFVTTFEDIDTDLLYGINYNTGLVSTSLNSIFDGGVESKSTAPQFGSYSINQPSKALESRLFRPLFDATPSLALNIPSTTPLGENFTFTASFSNSGDPGYGPFIDIVLPAKGVDGVYPGTDPGDVYDGISFVSASFAGISIPADQLFVQTFPDDDGSGTGTTGCVTHPIAVRPAGGTDGHGESNPESPVYYEACGESGYQFITIILPFGSFVPAQPPVTVTITAHMSELADLSQPLNIRGQAGFRFGNTAIADFCCDPWDATLPVDGDGEYDVLDFGSVGSVEPSLLSISKAYVGPEYETATGPNFPRQFTISVDIADSQVIGIAGNPANFVISDTLPDNIQFLSFEPSNPVGAICTTNPDPLNNPGGDFSCSFDSVQGTIDSVTFIPNSVDAEITFNFYVDRLDEFDAEVIDATTGAPTTSGNTASATGTWDPIDGRDDTDPLPTASANCGVPCVSIEDQSITVQKSYENLTPPTTNNSPDDVIEYTLNFQVSDFFGFEDINLTDTFSDGQRFDTTFTPTIQLNGNDDNNIGTASAMNADNVDIDCKYTGADAASAGCDTTSGVDVGKTTIVFNISDELITRFSNGQLLGGCVNPDTANNPPSCSYNNGATEGTITFRTKIQDDFSDEHLFGDNSTDSSVDHGDILGNDVDSIVGEVLTISTAPVSELFAGNGNHPADDSGVAVDINFGVLTKDLFAVNGSTTLPTYVSPGDVVTYVLTYTQPTSDFEETVLTDFFPLPVFSSTELTFLNNQPCTSAYSPKIVPPAGVICLGAADDYHNLNLPIRGELLAPAIPPGNLVVEPTFTTDSAANSLTVTYTDYDSVYNIDSTMQLLISLTVESDPFADGLFLTNQATSTEGTTNAGDLELMDIVQIRIGEPVLFTAKTAVSTDHIPTTDLEFIPDPASLEALMAQFAAPSGSGVPFTGTITSQDISTDPNDDGAAFDLFNSTLVGVDGGDLVKYAILIENKGHSENGAYDVALSDLLPADMGYPGGDPANLNLQIYNGAGVVQAFEVINSYGGDGVPGGGDDDTVPGTVANATSLFDPTLGIRIVDPSGVDVPGACQVASLTSGANILVITYDLQLNLGVAPDTDIINTVSLLGYGADEGGENFLETPELDDAIVRTKPEPDFDKVLTSTSVLDNDIVGPPAEDRVVVGELLTYTLDIKFFELDYTNVTIVDTLDPGLAFVELISVTNSNPDTDDAGTDTGLTIEEMTFTLYGSDYTCDNCFAGTTTGSNPLVTNNGGTVTFNFGDLTNNDDDNTVGETVTIVYRAVATNVITSDAGDLLGNSAELSWDSASLTDDDNDTILLEPYITTLKEAGPGLTDAGNLITYKVTLTNGNGPTDTDAFDVVWTDTLPAEMNYVSGPTLGLCSSPPDTLLSNGLPHPTFTATWDDANDFPKNSDCIITFTATVDYSVNPGEVIPNIANTTWTSLPGPVTNVAEDYNTDDDERTGADGVGVEPDDYASTDTGSVTITNPALQKYLMQTSEPHTSLADVAIGEIVRYRLVVAIPEGTSPNFQVRDNIPDGLIFLNDGTARLSFISNQSGISSTEITNIADDIIYVDDIPSGCTTSGASADNTSPPSPLNCPLGDTNIANTGDVTLNTDVYNSDTNVFFRLGNLVNNDNDPDAEYVVIEFNALTANTNNNYAGDVLRNTARSFINGVANGVESLAVNVTVAEPLLDINKVITTAANDASDLLVYRITVTNSGVLNSTAAFELNVNDPIDSNLNLTGVVISYNGVNGSTAWAGSCGSTVQTAPVNTSTLGNPGIVSVDIACLNPGENVFIDVSTTVVSDALAGLTIPNTATVIGTSLPGGAAGVYDSDGNGTGSNVPGNPATITGERDGSDTNTGGRNDYYDLATVSQVLDSPAPEKLIESTSEIHTDDSSLNTIADPRPLVIGEILRYRLVVQLPEGTNQDLTLVDVIPSGLSFMTGTLELEYLSTSPITNTDGTASTDLIGANAGPITLPATYFVLTGQTLTIDLESPINNDSDAGAEFAVLEFNVLVNNDVTNQNTTVHDNLFSVSVSGNPAIESNHVYSEVLEPKLDIVKTADSSNWHYEDTVIYSVVISHVNDAEDSLDSTEDAYDITITDSIPTELTFVSVTSLPGDWTQSYIDPILTLECLDINSCSLPLDSSVTISFTATVNKPDPLPPGLSDPEYLDGAETAVNTANMVWTSLPGTGSAGNPTGSTTPGASGDSDGERNGNTSGQNDYNDADSHTGQLNYYALGNRVWFDTDNSATINGTEVGVSGVTVELYDAGTMTKILTGPDGIPNNGDEGSGDVTTDANGYYIFDYLEEGDYVVVLPSTNFTTGVLAGYYSSQTTISDVGVLSETAALDPDNDLDSDDNGTLTSGDVVSLPVTLGLTGSTEPENESDPQPVTMPAYQVDGRTNLTVDFGFYRKEIGDLVYLDENANGTYDSGTDTVLGDVTVELFAGDRTTWLGTTSTDSTTGLYLFDDLTDGNYYVRVETPADLVSTIDTFDASDNADPDDSTNNNDNGIGIGFATSVSVYSGQLTLVNGETGATITAVDSTGTTTDLSVDFGFTYAYALGNRVWFDTDNSATINGSEVGVDSVVVELYLADGSGDPMGPVLETDTTASGGYYLFDYLTADDYVVVLPASNFSSGAVLNGYWSSGSSIAADGSFAETPAPDPDLNATDSDDNGTRETSGDVISEAVTVGPTGGTEPTGESDLVGLPPDGDGKQPDDRANMTVDFGFYRTEIGNLVFADVDKDGRYNGPDTLYSGAVVQLYSSNGTEIPVGTDGILGTADDGPGGTVTNGSGIYLFSGLPAGNFIVGVTAPDGTVSTIDNFDIADNATPNTNTDDNDNGIGFSDGLVLSNILTMNPGSLGDKSNNIITNNNGNTINPTIDFGFSLVYGLGNRVWFDTDNNSQIDSGEVGVDGVSLELYAASDLSTILDTYTTANDGYYLFDYLEAGDYVVLIPASNFGSGAILEGYWSSATSRNNDGSLTETAAPDPDDDTDSDDNGTLSAGDVVSLPITLGGTEPTGEDEETGVGQGDQPDDQANLTVDFGFYTMTLGNLVWIDTDNSGTVNGVEPGVDNVTLQLWTGDGLTQLDTTTTTGAGIYSFTGQPAGDYIIQIPAFEFEGTETLRDFVSSTGPGNAYEPAPDTDTDTTDSDDNGTETNGTLGLGGFIHTLPITLTPAGEFSVNNNTGTTLEPRVDFGVYSSYLTDLAIDKDDGVTEYVPGGTLTYTIRVDNFGPSDVSGATLTDNFPVGINSSSTTWTCVGIGAATCTASGTGNINDTAVNIPFSSTIDHHVTYTVIANIDSGATANPLVNTAAITPPINVTETDSSNNSDNDSDTPNYISDLSIDKDDSTLQYVPGGTLTYIIRVDNIGPSDVSGASVTDTFPPEITSASWTCAGSVLAATCTTPGTGDINDTVNIPAGEYVTYTVNVSVDPAATGALTNVVNVNHPADSNSANNQDDDQDTQDSQTDLSITKDDGQTIISPNATLPYTIDVINNGPSDVLGATVADTFPGAIASATWTCVGSVPAATCTSSGSGNINDTVDLPAGELVTYTVNALVSSGASGSLTNTVVVTAPGYVTELDTTNNDASDTDVIPAITKTLTGQEHGVTTLPDVAIGEIITYRVELTVPTGTMDNLHLIDSLDQGLAFVDCVPNGISGPGLTMVGPASFDEVCDNPVVSSIGSSNAVDAGRQVDFNFGILENTTGNPVDLTVIYRVVVLDSLGNQNDSTPPLNNTANWVWASGDVAVQAIGVTILEPDLSLSKSVSPSTLYPGQITTFTLVVEHTPGSQTSAYEVEITDVLPPELIYQPPMRHVGGQVPTTIIDGGDPTLIIRWVLLNNGDNSVIEIDVMLDPNFRRTSDDQEITNEASLVWTSLPGDFSTPQSTHNSLSTERFYDPLSNINIYGVGDGATIRIPALPDTGFAPGVVTDLPLQKNEQEYGDLDGLRVEIPKLDQFVPIVSVPLSDNGWDLTWLWNQAGWLEGTAYPSWYGNTVITGHAYLPSGLPGPFVDLDELSWGDEIFLYAHGLKYTYQVRSAKLVAADDYSILQHKDQDWLTLFTCKEYNDLLEGYVWRQAVQAVLIDVEEID